MNGKTIPVKELTLVALMTAVICILAPLSIAIPISPVPISFTSLALFFAVMLLGQKYGTISYLLYLLLGLVGMPVFSAFTAGPGKLLGPTGGYLVGYLATALIAGWFVDRADGRLWMYFLGMGLGNLAVFAIGTIWLAYQAKLGLGAALMAGTIPYIPGDIVKIVIAVFAGKEIRKRLSAAGLL